ncbi:MAG: hypothetical protein ACOX8E_06650 [Ruminococcus sp.]|jgi:foldase protein PrsA
MRTFKIKTACVAAGTAICMAALAGCGSGAFDGTQTAAVVDGQEIPAGVLSFAVRYQQAQTEYYYSYMYSMYGSSSDVSIWDNETEDGETFGEQTRQEVLENVEKMYLVRERADEYGLEISEDESASIDEAAQSFIDSNDPETLEKIGVSEEDVKEYLELYTYYEKAYEPVTADVEIEVTDEEAAQSTLTYAFLSTNDKDDDEKQEVYDEVESLLKEIQASDDPASADIETMAEDMDDSFITTSFSYGADDTTLDEAVKEAASGLEDGQVYDGVVEGEAGYFVVRLDKKLDEEATASREETLKVQKQQEAFDEIVQDWYDEADVEVRNSVWKKIKLTDDESFRMAVPETAEDTGAAENAAGEETNTEDNTAEEETDSTDSVDTEEGAQE